MSREDLIGASVLITLVLLGLGLAGGVAHAVFGDWRCAFAECQIDVSR